MKKAPDNLPNKKDKQNAESLVSLIYYFAKDWMRPSPKQPVVLQVLIFILKLPVLILLLALSPVIFIFLFITLVVGL